MLLGTALLLASGNAPALGKDILLQGMLHNKFNVIDGDKDEIVATIETKGKKVTNFTWDPRDLDKVYTITDWGQQIEQLDLAGKKVVRTFRMGSGDVKVRTLDIELNPANPNLLYALSLRQRWLSDEIVDMTPAVLVLDLDDREGREGDRDPARLHEHLLRVRRERVLRHGARCLRLRPHDREAGELPRDRRTRRRPASTRRSP